MSKFILLLSFFGIAFLLVSSLLMPNAPAMWLASTSRDFELLRIAMMLLLVSLLVTNPPRNVYLRAIVGAFAVGLGSWSLFKTYTNQLQLLDSLSMLQVSVSTGLAVLERKMAIFTIQPKASLFQNWLKSMGASSSWVLNLR